jgi:hypothetical protein
MTAGETGTQSAWTIAPVHVATSYLPKARFDHGSHRTGNFKCADCHDVEHSHSSADVSIPDIANCRRCHAGSEPAGDKVVSTCISCHAFHVPGHPPFGTRPTAAETRAGQ